MQWVKLLLRRQRLSFARAQDAVSLPIANHPATLSSKHFKPSLIALPTVGNMIFVSLLFVLLFHSGQGLLADGDTGYHIRTGELILKQWRVPTEDPYSFHEPRLKWTAHEWLAEVIMAGIFQAFGLTGVVVFFAVLLASTHWLLYRSLYSRSESILLCTLIALLATAASSSHWLARPHVFSLFLTVIWYHGLDRFQYRNDARFAYYAPVLMLAWVNLHGGFIFGLLLTGIYTAGNVLYVLTGNLSERAEYRSKASRLFLLFLGLLAVCLINPHGFEILWFPFRVASDRFVMDRVIEFQPPNFHETFPFKYMLLATIGALALSRSPLNCIEAVLVTLLSYMALYSARHVSLFAIIVAPILLKSVENAIARLPAPVFRFYEKRNQNLAAVEQNLTGYLWPALSLIFVCVLAWGGGVSFQFDAKRFPVAAAEFLKQEPITGHMFNNDEFGDYLIFAAWPAYHVFMDGRSDMYGAHYGRSYFTIAGAQRGWKTELEKYNITWVIFDTFSPLTAALQEDRQDWQPIYADRIATVFVKKTPAHAALVAKYPGVTIPSL